MQALSTRTKLVASPHLTIKWSEVIRGIQINVFVQYKLYLTS